MSVFTECPELVEEFRAGKREALECVYRYYARQVERYLRKLARAAERRGAVPPAVTADLFQEVFVRAFSASARAKYDTERDYDPYLMAIARNCFIDALRTGGREVLQGETDWPEDVVELDDWENALDPVVRAILTAYVHNLPASLRGVYEQRFVLGRSQQAACDALGLSRGRLRTNEQRLKRGLRKALCAKGFRNHKVGLPLRHCSEAK